MFRKYLPLALTLLAGICIGFLLRGLIRGKPAYKAYEVRLGGWKYINPLLECEQPLEFNPGLIQFKNKVDTFIREYLRKKRGDEVSVYFRDLNDGHSFTIGRKDQFYPASLIKVPWMISILKKAETDPAFLKRKIAYNSLELKPAQNTDAAETLVFGRSYTVEELMERMIKYSDNISTLLLEDALNPRDLRRVYDDLGIPDPGDYADKNKYVLSVETYSSFFRILYNASYLTKTSSEKALEYLSNTDYTKGLVAGVPPGTTVAHKFGLRTVMGKNQWHDCGIVYYPGRPYLLCIMTSSLDSGDTGNTLGDISRFIYKEMERQHR